jgi:uncharacterized protein YjbJ (UPF0337 family)
MNKDSLEGSVRSTIGQGEKIVGHATGDSATEAKGVYDNAAGKARSALGSAKEAVSQGVDTVSAVDFSGLRDEVAKLTQTVAGLAQKQMSSAMGAAGDSLSQSTAIAQDKLAAAEGDVEARIKKNPWGAVAIAALIGLLIGKIT